MSQVLVFTFLALWLCGLFALLMQQLRLLFSFNWIFLIEFSFNWINFQKIDCFNPIFLSESISIISIQNRFRNQFYYKNRTSLVESHLRYIICLFIVCVTSKMKVYFCCSSRKIKSGANKSGTKSERMVSKDILMLDHPLIWFIWYSFL